MSAFLRLLWSGRTPRTNPRLQERIAAYTLTQPRTVKATPIHPPVRRDDGA